MSRVLCFFISMYRKYVSPMFPRRCKYYPTCSEYAFEALRRFGFFKGVVLSLWRLLRCNPFSKGGYDPVPETSK